MVLVRAFRALRPRPDLAHALVSVPYDVVSRDEAAALAASSPHSFLHVTKPEIDLPADADPYGADVYLRGRENLERMVDDGVLVRDPHESYYVYRLEMGGRAQTGVVVAVRCAEYDAGIVRRHELTRPDKEDDRVAHIKTLSAQTGVAFLVHRSSDAIAAVIQRVTSAPPENDVVTSDGVRHQFWLASPAEVPTVTQAFAAVPLLYVADGHHRIAAACRIARERREQGEAPDGPAQCFLAVSFPQEDLAIMPYNRHAPWR
jgi:uncharacterized protein (DUF1015 family)